MLPINSLVYTGGGGIFHIWGDGLLRIESDGRWYIGEDGPYAWSVLEKKLLSLGGWGGGCTRYSGMAVAV